MSPRSKPMPVNYDQLAEQYKKFRAPDPRIESAIWGHLAGAKRILNVGAGLGSYEPPDCEVVAIEPSKEMIALRKESAATVVNSRAENLPFGGNEFDASMGILTIHHWSDIRQGLSEMLRVTRNKLILFTWIGYGDEFWLEDYFPEVQGIDEGLFPTLIELEQILGPILAETVEIPHDCTDGFMCAYWRRPEIYLDADARKAISTFSRIPDIAEGLRKLESDLHTGIWSKKYGHLLARQSMDLGYRMVVRDMTLI